MLQILSKSYYMPKHGKNLIYTFKKKWLHAPNLMKMKDRLDADIM